MARPIDEKIVAMKMDNSDFKRKAIETTGIFGKLRDSLNRIPGVNLGSVTKDLSGIQRAANNTDLSVLARSVDSIASRFSNLGVMATTALVNITNKAVDTGLALGRSLGPDQVADGFREYEQKIGSIGTMLANTKHAGSTLDDVKKTLNELNDYADNTIYNFGQMTQSIGRFTAAGVSLEDSTTAIKGLSNMAALSGSTSEQLNSAMYQMSQALSGKNLRAIDWISLTNAGMGGKIMQDALVKNAKAMGQNVDVSDGFQQSLEKGWLTTEVFLETLKQFGEDESMTEAATKVRTFTGLMSSLREGIGSGWATTWELIFGDFEEATLLWTTISDVLKGVFDKQAEVRNGMLQALIDGDGLENLIGGIKNVAEPIIQIFKAIGDGFRIAFPPMGVSGIERLLDGFKNLTSGLKFSGKSVNNIKTIFAGFFSIFAIGLKIIKGAGVILLSLIPSFEGLGSKILELVAMVAKIPIAFNKSSSSGDAFSSTVSILKTAAGGIAKVLESVVGGLIAVGSGFKSATGYVDSMNLSFSPLAENSERFFNAMGKGLTWIKDKATGIGKTVRNMMPSGNELFAGGFIAGLVAIVGVAIKMAHDLFQVFTGWGKIGQGVADVLDSVAGALNAFSMQVRAQALLTIAIAIGVLAGSFLLISGLDSQDITQGLYVILGSMTTLVTALAIMNKYDIAGGGISTTLTIIALAVAFSIMAGALNKIKDFNWNEIGKGLTALVVVMGSLAGAVAIMGKFGGAGVGASALQLIAIAGSIYILMLSLEKISKFDFIEISKGLTGLAGVLILLTGAVMVMSRYGGKMGASALQFVAIAGSVLMLVSAIEKISDIDPENLQKGLKTIALILGAIAIFTVVTSGKGLLSAGVGILLLATAITALMAPILILGNTDLEVLGIGLGAIAIALVAIGAASMLMTGMLASGAGLILMAIGINMLIVPIAALGNMKWQTLVIGILGLTAALLLVGGAAILLGLAAPALLLGAAGIALIGVAMLAAGAGMSLFSTGLLALATMTAASITTIVAVLGTLIMGLASLIPMAVDFVVKIINQLADAVSTNAPILYEKFLNLVLDLIDILTVYVPQFIEKGTNFILALLDGLGVAIPLLIDGAMDYMIKLMDGMSKAIDENGHKLIESFMRLMGEIIILIIDAGAETIKALFNWVPGVEEAMTAVSVSAEKTVRDKFNAKKAAEDKGVEFATGLSSKEGTVKTAGEGLGKAGKDGAGSVNLTRTGENVGLGFVQGIGSDTMMGKVKRAAKSLADAVPDTIARILGIHSPADVTDKQGQHTGQGFVNGVEKKKKDVKKSANSLAGVLLNVFGIEVPKESAKGGKATGESFAKGVDSTKHKSSQAGKNTGKSYAKGIGSTKKDAEDAAKAVAEAAKKQFEASKKWIDDRKYYHELSLTEELTSWQNIQNKYKQGTEQRAEADREVYRLKNEINSKLISINDEYVNKVQEANQKLIDGERALNAEYEQAVADRTKALTGFAGLFDEVNSSSDVSGYQLLDNLKAQVDTFISWGNNLNGLVNRGLEQGLLDELREMGPRAAAEIAALNTLTDEQLVEYSNLWKTKNELAHNTAVTELEGLKNDTSLKITELQEQTAAQLDQYKQEWIDKITEIKVGVVDQYVGLNASMKDIGKNTIRGLMSGLTNMTPSLMAQAKAIADAIRETIASALEVNSPSRVTTVLGEYVGEGLVVGIASKIKAVANSAKTLALTAKDSLNQFLEGFELPSEENELHFKAVIDYDEFDPNGFGKLRPISIIPDTRLTNSLASSTIQAKESIRSKPEGDSTTDNSRNFNPVTNIYAGNTAKEITRANERSMRKLAYQFGV